MALSPELVGYSNENDLVQRFLVPVLGRLGFGIVVNNHGTREAGMDLVVGEIDRFSHVRYHGIQAKFQGSVSKSDSHGLVQDAIEAFATEFCHPQTGEKHWISSFYAINAGTISDEARSLFFAQLRHRFGDNVRLLEGRDLVALDRSAAIRTEGTREYLAGLFLETRRNAATLARVVPRLIEIRNGDGHNVVYPVERLRAVALSSWLAKPILLADFAPKQIEDLYSFAIAFNQSLDEAGASPLHTVLSIKIPASKALRLSEPIRQMSAALEATLHALLASLGPLTPL